MRHVGRFQLADSHSFGPKEVNKKLHLMTPMSMKPMSMTPMVDRMGEKILISEAGKNRSFHWSKFSAQRRRNR